MIRRLLAWSGVGLLAVSLTVAALAFSLRLYRVDELRAATRARQRQFDGRLYDLLTRSLVRFATLVAGAVADDGALLGRRLNTEEPDHGS